MKPAHFDYHRASTVEHAVNLLVELGDEARVLAGGQSLIPMMNFRLARPAHLIDITGIEDLNIIRRGDQGQLHLGALVTHHQVERLADSELDPGHRLLRNAMSRVGHLPIRTVGTVGGSLAHGDSTGEWAALAILYSATIVVHGPSGRRTISAEDFTFGTYTTALEPDEVLTEIIFPAAGPNGVTTEFARRRGDFALVAAAIIPPHPDHKISGRVMISGPTPTPIRIQEAERVLQEGTTNTPHLSDLVADIAASSIDYPDDGPVTGSYGRSLVHSIVKHCCEEAVTL